MSVARHAPAQERPKIVQSVDLRRSEVRWVEVVAVEAYEAAPPVHIHKRSVGHDSLYVLRSVDPVEHDRFVRAHAPVEIAAVHRSTCTCSEVVHQHCLLLSVQRQLQDGRNLASLPHGIEEERKQFLADVGLRGRPDVVKCLDNPTLLDENVNKELNVFHPRKRRLLQLRTKLA